MNYTIGFYSLLEFCIPNVLRLLFCGLLLITAVNNRKHHIRRHKYILNHGDTLTDFRLPNSVT